MKKISDKQKLKNELKKEETRKLHSWFLSDIWEKRPHYCEECNKWLGEEPLSIFFDHLIEKSSYPEFTYEINNIFLCCGECHTRRTNGFPYPKHKKAIEEAKKRFNKF